MSDVLRLRRDLTEPFPTPDWPKGVALIGFAPQWAEAVHALIASGSGAESFPAFAPWWQAVSSDPEYDPELVLIAQAPNGTAIGIAHCWTTGFLKDLAVDPAWRNRGVAKALLSAVFRANRERGKDYLDLKVNRENIAARALYKCTGFVEIAPGSM